MIKYMVAYLWWEHYLAVPLRPVEERDAVLALVDHIYPIRDEPIPQLEDF